MSTLASELNRIVSAHPFETRYHIYDFRTTAEWINLGDKEGWSASTRKVSVMMALLARVHRGQADLAQSIEYTKERGEGVRSGTFRYMTPGFSFTLADALAQMIITSDNVCTGAVFESFGASEAEQIQAVNDYCKSIGMKNTVHRHTWVDTKKIPWYHDDLPMTSTSASDQVHLLKSIIAGAEDQEAAQRIGCSPELCRYALTLLRREFGVGISSLLPRGAEMASKGGRGLRGRSHVGIAYLDDEPRYAIAMYTDWVPVTMLDGSPGYVHALSTMAKLNRAAWRYLVERTARPSYDLGVGANNS